MDNTKLAIPVNGKMALRTFHTASFRDELTGHGFQPLYVLNPIYIQALNLSRDTYFELKIDEYNKFYISHPFQEALKTLRRFIVRTETTDLRFRETIEQMLFSRPIHDIVWYAAYTDILRRLPLGNLFFWIESQFYKTHAHDDFFKSQGVDCILTPGLGNAFFWYEGSFAREAKQLGIPVFGAITNYDNLVNMGYRGYDPVCLAVWSKQMADEAVKLHKIPAGKIEITGPMQYDRFLKPLPQSREQFLKSIGLNPKLKTILFAGSSNISHYFEIYKVLVELKDQIWDEPFNLIVRPHPHVSKLLGTPIWHGTEKLYRQAGIYISMAGHVESTADRVEEFKEDFSFDEEPDELTYLLHYSDLMINVFSTVSLEAAICDLPVIHLAFDTYTYGLRYANTTNFLQRQTHNRRPLRLAASKVAKDEEELIMYIRRYLENPDLEKEERRVYALAECGVLDGKASSRVVEMIKSRL